jgi:hypothetical protein
VKFDFRYRYVYLYIIGCVLLFWHIMTRPEPDYYTWVGWSCESSADKGWAGVLHAILAGVVIFALSWIGCTLVRRAEK